MIESAPYLDDIAPLAKTSGPLRHPMLFLTPSGARGACGRFSVFTADPVAIIRAQGPRDYLTLRVKEPFESQFRFARFQEAAEVALRMLAPWPQPTFYPWDQDNLPFTGGLAGGIAYEYGAHFETMKLRRPTKDGPPPLWMGLYPCAYIADHVRREAWLIRRKTHSMPDTGGDTLERLRDLVLRASATCHVGGPKRPAQSGQKLLKDWRDDWEGSMDAVGHAKAVQQILDYLHAGDVYQINLTVRHRRKFTGNPDALISELGLRNPGHFMALLRMENVDLISCSPELFLDVTADGWAETHPIKGTRAAIIKTPDGLTAATTPFGPKEQAEHVMIVDLERNDLGKVCRYGSVGVDPLMEIREIRGLEHMVSVVRGRLGPGRGALDAFAALFPGGSVTGAPKIRAMELIHELEPVARGYYTGALGWICPEGHARMSLAIRTLVLSEERLDLHVGGGIVADSDPALEYEECRIKGQAIAETVAELQACDPRTEHPTTSAQNEIYRYFTES